MVCCPGLQVDGLGYLKDGIVVFSLLTCFPKEFVFLPACVICAVLTSEAEFNVNKTAALSLATLK